MINLYHDSENIIVGLKSGKIPKGSVIRIIWPSGNSEEVRFHRWDTERNMMLGCNMGWDNGALDAYDLSHGAIVSLIERSGPIEKVVMKV